MKRSGLFGREGRRARGCTRRLLAGLPVVLATASCGLWSPAASPPYSPSLAPVGPLTIGVWLPAGLGQFRFAEADQRRLLQLGVNWLEWLQPEVVGSSTAEEVAMGFCGRHGLQMPVYYEPRGWTIDDKLHDWIQGEPGAAFKAAVEERVRALQRQWQEAPGFGGYLVGHEDYRYPPYTTLQQTVEVLRQLDPVRPAYIVGGLDHYPELARFLDAFLAGPGPPNVFQHEQYVVRGDLPVEGPRWVRAFDGLRQGYDRVARRLQGRSARWHAVVQAHQEVRDGQIAYRRPAPAELSLQVGLALSRGASGVIYFLYSSGPEQIRQAGRLVQERWYDGLVDAQGEPGPLFAAAAALNARLREVSPVLAGLHFRGGYPAVRLPANPVLADAEPGLEIGLFGSGTQTTHALVVDLVTSGERTVWLRSAGPPLWDAVSGAPLPLAGGRAKLRLEPGGFRLLAMATQGE
ncbi:MAG: hypothetical protein AB1505_25715 [Candidatus Latescibacterota bacterium]